MPRRNQVRANWLLFMVLAGCAGEPGGKTNAIPSVPSEADPGTEVVVATPEAARALTLKLEEARLGTADDVRAEHSVRFDEALGYDPLTAAGLEQVLDKLYLSQNAELRQQLAAQGFAVAPESQLASFVYGYSQIYAADLPVFVSADMVLEAIYRSHDKILLELEKQSLRPRLSSLLTSVRQSLRGSAGQLEPEVASDLDFYFAVALSLLDGGRADSQLSPEALTFVQAAMAGAGEQRRTLFGVDRLIDFSQFKPRGHYAGDVELESYFRAMIWLGRTDFRLLETQVDGSQVLRRRQVESVVALRRLLDAAALADYRAIDDTISAFVGEHDYMTLPQVDDLLADLQTTDLAAVDDETLARALIAGQYGEQRIASQVMRRNPGGGAFPLSQSFALFGQRYTVDSHVLSNVVYDRLPTRVLPNALDAAFAALGNDQALGLLGDELDRETGFAGQLSAMRLLVDEHPPQYWDSSLYTSWLSALRTLSPQASPASELPSVARTEAWGRRLLNTQLSSWAQLRHNNVLYVKQSYTSGAACEYPDAYVDPYPEFFDGIVRFAERAQQLTANLGLQGAFAQHVQGYFERVARINRTLSEMAVAQRSGAPHSAEHLAFINQAVTTSINCDGSILGHTGWYSELHFDPLQAVKMDPIITDVHTDVGGPLPVARDASVLHVGTALPRLMVMTVDSCQGPRAYAGVVSAYSEFYADGLTRLTDDEWKTRLELGDVPPVASWLAPVFGK